MGAKPAKYFNKLDKKELEALRMPCCALCSFFDTLPDRWHCYLKGEVKSGYDRSEVCDCFVSKFWSAAKQAKAKREIYKRKEIDKSIFY